MDIRIKDRLVMSAFYQAVGRDHSDEGLIVQTNRGSQYTSQCLQSLLLRYGCRQSMNRKGNPYDNAVMESFYRTPKRELVQDADYNDPEQARMNISSISKPTITRSPFILLWAGLAQFSLKHKIFKCLTLCIVFLNLSWGRFAYCLFFLRLCSQGRGFAHLNT